jgi:hypothetical protein
MMKRMMSLVMLVGFLVTTADLKAADGRYDRLSAKDGPTSSAMLSDGPQLLAVTDYATPPPAPALDAVPPGPAPPVVGPAPPAGMPLPEAVAPMSPVPLAAGGPPLLLAPAPALFPCVKYKDRHHIAPCAVPMYVAVRDPCDRPRHVRCSCDTPKCVMVEICVPPCGTPRITYRHDGTKVRYDYGKYAVNITSRHGIVVVNYDR